MMQNLVIYLTFITGLVFSGCSHTTELTRQYLPEKESDTDYTVIYYIHADSDYLYHAPDGSPVRGNSGVLATALDVAEEARSGEVFIFYQRPERKLLGLFPRKSSRFYHYTNGQLINQVKYRHTDKDEAFLVTEAQLLNQYQNQNQTENHQNYFLYFGHEVPAENGQGYHRSLRGIDVNTVSLTNGIQNFLLSDDDRFDLVVLSTCNNGTPAMAELLIPFTDLLLASPQNLHLSHIDSDRMDLLEKEPGISALQLGHLMAEQTYQRLAADIHATITLSLYEFEDVRSYINNLTSLTAAGEGSDRSAQFQDNVDCTQTNTFKSETYRQGVKTWYKPARFGRQASGTSHSGWGCKPETE